MESMYQWASQPQVLQADSSNHHQSPSTSLVDDWTKDRSSSNSISTNGGVGSPLGVGHGGTLDLSEFGLGDLGSTSSVSSMVSPTPSFYTYQQPYSYNMPNTYGATSYGMWSSQNLPVSNYSTLNGATTSPTTQSTSSSSLANATTSTPSQTHSSPTPQHTQSYQPQPQTHTPSPVKSPQLSDSNSSAMNIDPALTTLNGSGSNSLHYYPSSYATATPTTPQQSQLTPAQLQQLLAYYSGRYQTQQLQQPLQQQTQPQASQGTLSPALLSSSNSLMQGIIPRAFYGSSSSSSPSTSSTSQQQTQPAQPPAPPPKPKLTLEERNVKLMTSVRPMLKPNQFSGAGAVNNLTDKIDDFPASEVPAATRLEILTKIRDGAGNHYFRAWSENPIAMDITRDWLKAAYVADPESALTETVMPLLHIIDRLPLTLDTLKASKLGKLVVKLVKESPTPAVKDMAANIERRWRVLIESANKPTSESEDLKTKKRKLESSAPSKTSAAPPAKKPAVASSTASKPVSVKKESASSSKSAAAAAVKDAKSDSSFFSAPKPKPKLPSFKKAPAPPPAAAQNIAQPSPLNAFEEAVKSMAKGRKSSPAVSTPPGTNTSYNTTASQSRTKPGTKKKKVTWASEDKLVSVRLIEKAIYDDDPKDGVHVLHSIRELDRSEGAALHAHMFEEAIDWSEPMSLEFVPGQEPHTRGEGSEEKQKQEQREATALTALYMSPAQIPDSPAEPAHVISEEETDKNVTTIVCGPEADTVFWSGPPAAGQSVADLVGQLASGNMAVDPAVNNTPFNSSGLDLGAVGLQQSSTLSAISALPQEQLQQLLQQLAANQGALPNLFASLGAGAGAEQQHPPYGNTADQTSGGWGATNNYGSMDYTMGSAYQDDSDGNWRGKGGRGGRGRGGGVRRPRPCSFFQQGRCKFGDKCDFSHEIDGGGYS